MDERLQWYTEEATILVGCWRLTGRRGRADTATAVHVDPWRYSATDNTGRRYHLSDAEWEAVHTADDPESALGDVLMAQAAAH